MKKIALTILVLFSFVLTGCAGMGGNDAYAAAHKSAADSRTAESNNRAKADETLALAVTSLGKGCESDICRGMALMTFNNMRQAIASAVATAAPVIAPPVNEVVEVFKDLTKTAVSLYGIRVGGAVSLVNATRGPADASVTGAGIKALDIYNANPDSTAK